MIWLHLQKYIQLKLLHRQALQNLSLQKHRKRGETVMWEEY